MTAMVAGSVTTQLSQSGAYDTTAPSSGNSRSFPLALIAIFLAVAPQMVYAQEVCSLLDRVVAAVAENPPFNSVRHLNVPNATQCGIFERGKRNGWLCHWVEPALTQAKAYYERTDRKYDRADRKYDRAWDRSFEADMTASEALMESIELMNTVLFMRLKAEADRLKAEADRLKTEADRLKTERNQAKAEKNQAREAVMRLVDGLHSQAQTLVSSIQQCFDKDAIRGSWGSFEYEEEYDEYEEEYDYIWQTCQDSELGVCLQLRRIGPDTKQNDYHLSLEVFR